MPTLFNCWENAGGGRTLEASGRKCLDLFDTSNPKSLLRKTLAGFLVRSSRWNSIRYSLTWKTRVIRRKYLIFQLQARAIHTTDKEFGLLVYPTPTATDAIGGCNSGVQLTKKRGNSLPLRDFLHSKYGAGTKSTIPNPCFLEKMLGYPPQWTNIQLNE